MMHPMTKATIRKAADCREGSRNSGMVKDQAQGEKAQAQNRIMEEPEIKRCPFCGSGAKLEEVESEDGYRFDVYCTNVQYCGGTTSRCRSAAKAIEFWNRRFPG
jgi:restriction alleviation protein Lar